MNDGSTRYFNMTTRDLMRLRSQKYNRISRLQNKVMGYFDQQEIRKLRHQMLMIDAVLNSRQMQETLPL